MKKIKVNENLTSLFNYINESEKEVSWFDLVQFAIDYKMYPELYLNLHVINKLVEEHDKKILSGLWKKPN